MPTPTAATATTTVDDDDDDDDDDARTATTTAATMATARATGDDDDCEAVVQVARASRVALVNDRSSDLQIGPILKPLWARPSRYGKLLYIRRWREVRAEAT